MTNVYKAPRIHCSGCVATVTGALRKLPGVERVEASDETKEVRVDFDPSRVTDAQIRAAMAAAGFPAA